MNKRIFILISCLTVALQITFAQRTMPEKTSADVGKKGVSADSVQTVKTPFKPNPRRSVLYSAVVPGLGQIYNRKYWKLPFVYAGYAALVYAISWNGGYYTKYKKAYVSLVDGKPTTNEYEKFIPAGQNLATVDSTWFSQVLNQKQMSYRNNRDLAIIGLIGFYGITLLDAFVDAQLFDFDISPNLSMRLEPVLNSSNFNSTTLGLRCQLTF